MKLKNMTMLAGLFSGIALFAGCANQPAAKTAAAAAPQQPQVTILYDAFGKDAAMKKDWGFSALIEVGGKRILFDTGNNSEIFAANAKAKGVDLTKLDFVVMSHRHGDHMGGLNHLLSVNPNVKIYAPKEAFGVYGAALPGTFYRKNESLPPEQRYFDGKPPETLRFGTPWPKANFTWVGEPTEVAPGIQLTALKGNWGVDHSLVELSLAIDTPDGTVVVLGCAHATVEKHLEAAKVAINKPVLLVVGGSHLLPAPNEEIQRIATALRDTWKVQWIAPGHCAGEPAFEILQKTFGDRYLYAGVGTVLSLGANVGARSLRGEAATLAGDDLAVYRMFARTSHDAIDYKLAHAGHAHE